MTKSKPLIFFGNERLSSSTEPTKLPILHHLIKDGFKVAAIVVSQLSSTTRNARKLEVEQFALEHKIDFINASEEKNLDEKLKSYDCDTAVLVAYGRIIPQATIDIFDNGIINIHPSLLPIYRGPTPIETAILDGVLETGVTLIKLDAKMDEGPILAQAEQELSLTESKVELTESLAELGGHMLASRLPKVMAGEAEFTEQEGKASYTKKISKNDGVIDWKKPARELEKEVRAYLDWPGSKTELADKEVQVRSAKLLDKQGHSGEIFITDDKTIGVYCGKDALEIISLKPAGKAEMTAKAFLAGNKVI